MNVTALRKVFAEIGWHVNENDYAFQVASSRQVVAGARSGDVALARRIVAIAADDPTTAPAGLPVPAAAPPAANVLPFPQPAAEREIRLGLDASREPVFLSDIHRRGLAAWHSIATYSPVGREAAGMLRAVAIEPLLPRAAALKIDAQAVQAWATAHGRDPAKTLQAEIEHQEQIARDKAILGPLILRGA